MTLSLSQDTASASIPTGSTATPPLFEIAQGFAQFCAQHPNSSFTATVESHGSTTQSEYIVCARLSLEGQPFITALGTAESIETAEDRARLRCLALAGMHCFPASDSPTSPSGRGQSSQGQDTRDQGGPALVMRLPAVLPDPLPIPAPKSSATPPPEQLKGHQQDIELEEREQADAEQSTASVDKLHPDSPLQQPKPADSANSVPTTSQAYLDDGLGEATINLGPLVDESPDRAKRDIPTKPSATKAKPTKSKSKKPKLKKAAVETNSSPTEIATDSEATTDGGDALANETFVADWSEDLAQIAVELKRLSWNPEQEKDYLQRSFQKSSLDDITDHRELMDYLAYLQALPTGFSSEAEDDSQPIAEAGLRVDEADLNPQSIPELMASAGLRSASDIAAPMEASAPPDPNIPAEIEPETLEASVVETTSANEAIASTTALSRNQMMDETARLCKQLGWKNRQGSDFLKATYGKATRKDLTDSEMLDFLSQLKSLSTVESLPY